MSSPEFIIKHYAGEVVYEVSWLKNSIHLILLINLNYSILCLKVRNFLDKNRDLLRTDVIDMLINSRNTVN